MHSSQPTVATLFSGGEGVGVGARAAGYRHLWGIERNADVAQVAELNGFSAIVADVQDVDPETLARPDVLHASPPCLDASGANGSRIESEEGKALGRAIARYIHALRPRVFTLENIWFYRTFESFQTIVDALFAEGYMVDWEHLNAADFGVPQTRQRLILRAVRGSLLPPLPPAEPWIGWYEAIEDLIPTLPESKFAPWQLKRLPEHLSQSALFSNQNSYDGEGNCYGTVYRESQEPAMTIRKVLVNARAFLLHPTADNDRFVAREADEPMFTIGAGNNMPRAFVVDGQNARDRGTITVRDQDEPIFTVVDGAKAYPRAFLVGSHYAQPNDVADRRVQTRMDDEPCFTITASDKGDKRAFLMPGYGNTGLSTSKAGKGARYAEEPATTVPTLAGGGTPPRAWLSAGRVVQMTPRALARLQTFPDSYELPRSRRLACYVIGNAAPPLMYQKISAQLKEVLA